LTLYRDDEEDLTQMAADFADFAESLYREALPRESSYSLLIEGESAFLCEIVVIWFWFLPSRWRDQPLYRGERDSSTAALRASARNDTRRFLDRAPAALRSE
jgi:hypothetical protein